MGFLVLAIVCSVLVSAWLKLARTRGAALTQMVAWNYLAAGALTALALRPATAPLQRPDTPWFALATLGVLLPTVFLALGASVRHAGIVRSEVAQRLSLLLSLLAAFAWFGQHPSLRLVLGLLLGLLALLAMVRRADAHEQHAGGISPWPLAVFAGFGVIDVLLKQVAAAGVPIGTSLLAMFALALPVALLGALATRLRDATRFTLKNLAAGLLLGALNFGNIYAYLRAHQALPRDPALVFAGMNLGVVMLGALVGVGLFRERLSRLNLLGLGFALLALGLLAG
jgi:drug/metabolite transporter (DMT)-like permease